MSVIGIVRKKRFIGIIEGGCVESRRARLKLWCQSYHKSLSSHRFFSANCQNLEHHKFGYVPVIIEKFIVPKAHA